MTQAKMRVQGPADEGPGLSLGRRLLFAGLMLGVVIVAIELLLQSYYYLTAGDFLFRRTLPPIYAADSTRCYGLVPNLDYVHHTNEFTNHIYTNSLGLRTDADHREVLVEKAPGSYRILMLGPSFAFGWGSDYAEIFPTLLEQRLRAPGKQVEMVNLGTPGQGPEDQLCWVKQFGRAFDFDMVVMTSYGAPVQPMPSECPERRQCPVVEDGHLYTAAPTPMRRFVALAKNSGLVFYGYYLSQSFGSKSGNEEVGKELHAKTATAVAEGDYDSLADGYEGFTRFIQRHTAPDTPVAFVFIPLSYVVHPEDAPRWSHLMDADPVRDAERIAAEIRALRERDIPIVHSVTAESAKASGERLYYWLDIHLTPAGNAVVADAAAPFLQHLIELDLERPPPAPDPTVGVRETEGP